MGIPLEFLGRSKDISIKMWCVVQVFGICAADSVKFRVEPYFRLPKVAIKNISPVKNNPKPINKQIVLAGCPHVVVHANAFNSQPKMIAPTEVSILVFLVNMQDYRV